mgnify:CR=1 FL=1
MLKPGAWQLARQGAVKALPQGAGYGAGFGATDAIINDKPLVESTMMGTGLGLLTAGALGGVTPLVGNAVGRMTGRLRTFAESETPAAVLAAREERLARLRPGWNAEPGSVMSKGQIEDVIANGNKIAAQPKSIYEKYADNNYGS